MEQTATDSQVLRAFRSRRRIRVATDGGLHKQKGTHGWVVMIASGSKILFKCAAGPFITSSSTRSELSGCASALLFIVSLSRFWGLRHCCKFLWYCDSSRAAISRIRRHDSRSSVRTRMPPDADRLAPIASYLRELRRTFTAVWVKGHQDTAGGLSTPLSAAAKLNIEADSLAT